MPRVHAVSAQFPHAARHLEPAIALAVAEQADIKVSVDGYLASAKLIGWAPQGKRARVRFGSGQERTVLKSSIVFSP